MMNTTFMPQPTVNNYTQGFAPQAQAPLVLPDDSDRVSSIVGYDVNNYVWGNGQIQMNPLNMVNPQYPTQAPACQTRKGKGSIAGFAILGALVTGGALLFAKAKGKNISFQTIKDAFIGIKDKVVNFFAKKP